MDLYGGFEFSPKKVWIKTFGCQMNYHDSERLLSHLMDLNFFQTQSVLDADLVIFNTCAIRDLANSKFYSSLGEIKAQKSKNPDLIVAVGGCISQVEGEQLLKTYKQLDFVFGPDNLDRINKMVYNAYKKERPFSLTDFDVSSDYSIETKITHGSPRAFVNIIKGCNNYCTYCIVPFTRGAEKSRKAQEVIEDVKRLVEHQGIQEVTLLGQNVNSFGKENSESFHDLLLELDEIQGLELLKYTTSHPYDMSDNLIKVHKTAKKLSRHLHLPVQSGSDSILDRMGRKYSKAHYLKLLDKLRSAKPDIVISSDIIVGFPQETEDEFLETIDLLGRASFDFIYSYCFSPRPGTKASQMNDSLPIELKKRRLQYLQKYQNLIQYRLRQDLVGKSFLILVEGHNVKNGQKKWFGRTNCNRIVHFLPQSSDNDADLQWNWVDIRINSATAFSCQGVLENVRGLHP